MITIDVENCCECPYFDEFSYNNRGGCKHPNSSRDCMDEYHKKAQKTRHYSRRHYEARGRGKAPLY